VELVDEESALELSRRPHPAPQLVALDELARRIAGIGEEQGGKTATLDLAPQVLDGEGVSALAFEEDGNGGERPEDVEELFVGRVVGQEMAQVHVAERRGGAGQRGAAAARD